MAGYGRSGLCLIICLVLIGCSTAPSGLLVPLATPPRGPSVDMLAATTRAPTNEPGVVFSGDRGNTVSFARLTVAVPHQHAPGTLQLAREAPGDPDRNFTLTSVKNLDQAGVRAWFRGDSQKPRRVFLFVHGFNTRFDRAVFRFAQLTYDADADAAPVLFSWPSRGRMLDYRRDVDNASYSRSDLAHLIEAAAASPHISEITILAHSMGSWLAVEALRQIALARNPALHKVNNLILASPDLDVGVFRRQVEDMGPKRPHITLFVAQNDRALLLSAFLARGRTRLGAIDPTQADYIEKLDGLKGVTVLDLTALQSNDRINHDLYAQSPAVVRLVGDRLIQGQRVTDDDFEPGNVVEAFGSVTTLMLAAPIVVVRTATGD